MVGVRARTGLLLLGLATSGCNGQIYHGPARVGDMAPGAEKAGETDQQFSDRTKEKGVLYHPDVTLIKTTTIKKKDGKFCNTNVTSEVMSVKDTSSNQRIWYEASWLENSTLAVVLGPNGGISSVNTTSQPDRGETFKNTASGLESLASVAGKVTLSAQIPPIKPGDIETMKTVKRENNANVEASSEAGGGCNEGTSSVIKRLVLRNLPIEVEINR